MVSVASFNVENLFARPKAFNTTNWSIGEPILAAYREFAAISEKDSYGAADRARMVGLLVELGIYYRNAHGAVRRRFAADPPWAWFAQEPWQFRPGASRHQRERADYRHRPGRLDRLGRTRNGGDLAVNLTQLFDAAGPLVSCFDLPDFDIGPRPGTFDTCSIRHRLDYILVSRSLLAAYRSGTVHRKGLWGSRVTRPTAWETYPEMLASVNQASDHVAVIVNFDL